MWKITETLSLHSRLLLGTARYPSLSIMQQAIQAAEVDIITVALRRQRPEQPGGHAFWDAIKSLGCHWLPNTAGCHNVQEAIMTAEMARELFETNWIKLEVIGDDYTLQPDPFELVKATQELLSRGFEVFPYCTDDLILCQRLVDLGCHILMPWAAPIGSGLGLLNPFAIATLRERLPHIILIIDAGIGKPSHATQAMEMGVDAVLLNSAVALAHDPIQMAIAFRDAIRAGRTAYEAGVMPAHYAAKPSTPLIDTPFWQQESLT
ncbi:MAG: thiazole synthase [Coxiella sp. RIFCSPHIGHO2_12_FULL_44_14]|nr:MAG: thiazole synthase [Coxiella sp. RIFCSPHIGHO2_12_FULL_44_14]